MTSQGDSILIVEDDQNYVELYKKILQIYDPKNEIEDPHSKMRDLSGKRNIKGREMQVKLIISA